jgi:ribosomal protein S18 acetylase RimI-like enzyme
MAIAITEAAVGDGSEILALQQTAYQSEASLYSDWTIPPLTQTLSQLAAEFDSKVILKAMDAGKIVGSARAYLDNGNCFIGRVIVHPNYQRKGIGTQLMLRMESSFPDARRFELFTGSKSSKNICFYQRLGYRIFREEDLSPNVRLVFMEKLRDSVSANTACYKLGER